MIGVGATWRESRSGAAGRLQGANDGAEVAWILDSVEEKVDPVCDKGQGIWAGPSQPSHSEDPTWRVGIAQLGQHRRFDLEGRPPQVGEEAAPFVAGQEVAGGEHRLERQSVPAGLRDEVRPLEYRLGAFTPLEAPNILDCPVLPALDRHAVGS